MATTTTNIALTKPASSEKVNLATLNANWDKLDTAIGAFLFRILLLYLSISGDTTIPGLSVY